MLEIVDLEKFEGAEEHNNLRHFDVAQFERKEELGQLNFADCLAQLYLVQSLYRRITPEIWSQLPRDLKTATITDARGLWNYIIQGRAFTPNTQNPKSERDGIANAIQSTVHGLIQRMAWLSLFKNDSEVELSQKLERATLVEQSLSESMSKADNALAVAKAAAAQVGVNAQVTHFGGAADDDEKLASTWLLRLVIAAITVAVVALVFVILAFYEVATTTTATAIQFTSAKVLLLAVATYAVLMCSKQYAAAKHNATVNRHKQLALKTFQSFVEGSQGSEARDAVLLKAATAVFEHQDSGYLRQQSSNQTPFHNVVELVTNRTNQPT